MATIDKSFNPVQQALRDQRPRKGQYAQQAREQACCKCNKFKPVLGGKRPDMKAVGRKAVRTGCVPKFICADCSTGK